MKKNNRETGAKAEAIACWFLGQQGYDILEQNFYTKVGEIDIIAKEGQTLVFVEVKYRKDDKKGICIRQRKHPGSSAEHCGPPERTGGEHLGGEKPGVQCHQRRQQLGG